MVFEDLLLGDFARSLLSLRCLMLQRLEETCGQLYVINLIRTVQDWVRLHVVELRPGSFTLRDITSHIKKLKLVKDVKIAHMGDIIRVQIQGCCIAKRLHKRLPERHLCPLLVPIIVALQLQEEALVRLREYPKLTEDGAEVILELVPEFTQ